MEQYEFTLDADPQAPGRARGRIEDWLAAGQWPDDELDAIVYAVSEAVSNAAEHAYPPGGPGPIVVRGSVDTGPVDTGPVDTGTRTIDTGTVGGRRARITVTDRGRWRMAPESNEGRRRGLFLMAACMDSVTIHRGGADRTGTQVILLSAVVPMVPGALVRPA